MWMDFPQHPHAAVKPRAN